MKHLLLITLLLHSMTSYGQMFIWNGDTIELMYSNGVEIELFISNGDTIYGASDFRPPPPDPFAFTASTTGQTANSFSFTATQNKAGKIKYVALTQADAVGLE